MSSSLLHSKKQQLAEKTKKTSFKIVRFIYDWPNPWDGLAPAPYYLTKHQSLLGNKITVFCGRWSKSGGPEKIEGVKLFSFPREPFSGLMLLTTTPLATAFFLIWRVFNSVDIYHVHGHFGLYVYLWKLLFGWLDKTPVVAHFHNTTAGRLEAAKLEQEPSKDNFFIKNISLPLSLLSDRLAIKIAKSYVFVSKPCVDEAVKYYGADRRKCFLIESGVATEVFSKSKKPSVGKESTEVLYVGALTERKNITSLVKSLEYLPPDYKLRLVGRGYESYTGRLKEIAKEGGFADRVLFEGYVENADLPKYYLNSSIFVIPSLYEGLPKVVLESLASGVPVLASGFDIKSPIKGLYFLDDPTPRKIANEIVRIMRSSVGVDVAYIERFYSWGSRALEIQAIYEKLF